MEDLSLHLLDIVENATAAGATLVEIGVRQDSKKNELSITVRDNGRGMESDMLAKVRDPFTTTRTTRRVGLGIPLLEQACHEAQGRLDIMSEPGLGTEVTAVFQVDHIDCKPLADMGLTLVTLIAGNSDVDFRYESNIDGEKIIVDTREIKTELDGICIADPEVLALIRNLFKKRRASTNHHAAGGLINGKIED